LEDETLSTIPRVQPILKYIPKDFALSKKLDFVESRLPGEGKRALRRKKNNLIVPKPETQVSILQEAEKVISVPEPNAHDILFSSAKKIVVNRDVKGIKNFDILLATHKEKLIYKKRETIKNTKRKRKKIRI